jgi:hypothetical protein
MHFFRCGRKILDNVGMLQPVAIVRRSRIIEILRELVEKTAIVRLEPDRDIDNLGAVLET